MSRCQYTVGNGWHGKERLPKESGYSERRVPLGRGALISVILVLTVLPQVLLVGNKLIEKTMIDFKKLLGGGADEQEKLDETK